MTTAIAINLLPHRAAKRSQRRRDFAMLSAIVAVGGLLLVFLIGGIIQGYIAAQTARNEFIKQENANLDAQIKEVASLRAEIESLRARQTAVENLQSDRNMPVYLLDELVKQTPEGIYLKSIKQEDQKVTLSGFAQSNERVSEMLRNFANNAVWVEKPNLIEIKVLTANSAPTPATRGPQLFEFSMDVLLKRPSAAKDPIKDGGKAGMSAKAAANAPAAVGAETPVQPATPPKKP